MRLLALALLASFTASAQQTVTKPGTTAPYAQNVQGCSGCTALGVTGSGTFDISDRVGRALGVVTIGAGAAAIGSITNTSFGATQGTSPWVTADNHTTAVAPLSLRLSEGAAFYDARQIRALTVADVVGLGAGSAVIGHVINDASSAVIGHVIHDSGSTTVVTGNVTVVQPTGTNLHAVLDTTSTTACTQATGTNLHAVLDTTSTTAVTQATPANLQATVTGAVLGHGTAATAMRVELPTDGTGVVGLVAGTTTAVTQATASSLNAQVVGTAADGSAASGNPVFVAGKVSTRGVRPALREQGPAASQR
jgi:hypothetical protein